MPPQDVDYIIEATDEPVHFRRATRRQDAEMDITPMIDITFLLLIFFLVATRLSSEGIVDLPKARNGTAVSSKNAVVVTVARGTAENVRIFKGDGAFERNQLVATNLVDQQSELEAYISQGLADGSKELVLIKAETGVRHRDVARVAQAAGDATAQVLYVAVLEER